MSEGRRGDTCLERAEELVSGPRRRDYRHPCHNFRAIGRKWASTLSIHLGREVEDLPYHVVGLMMVDLKTVREAGTRKPDNLDDAAGYLRCIEMCDQRAEGGA